MVAIEAWTRSHAHAMGALQALVEALDAVLREGDLGRARMLYVLAKTLADFERDDTKARMVDLLTRLRPEHQGEMFRLLRQAEDAMVQFHAWLAEVGERLK
jgi:hypothetical protein